MRANNRRLVFALSIVAASAALARPAAAQLAAGRPAFDQRSGLELVQFRDFFRNPFWDGDGRSYPRNSYDPYNPFSQPRQQQTYEALKPPPPAPRKADAPAPTETVLVIGDTFAEWLGYGLEQALADTPEIAVARRIKPYSGLVRYEARPDSPDWSAAVKDVLAPEKPAAIVVMLGVNDRLPLRDRVPAHAGAATPAHGQSATQGQGAAPGQAAPAPSSSALADTAPGDSEQAAAAGNDAHRAPPGGPYEFHTDKWAELYAQRIDEMIAALKTKGVPVLWVGMPAIRGTKSTTDMNYLNELYRARADKAGITYVDIWDGFVDDQGRYAVQGPDFEGQTRRLRTYDGVNFTKAGAEKLAHYVERELRRILTSHVVPVALPGPEEQTPAKGAPAGARPVVGPVVPLGAIGAGDGGELLGASAHPGQREADPLATRVLGRGEALAAPAGRADDFSWPRGDAKADTKADTKTNATPDAAAPAAVPAPAAPASSAPGKGAANKNETNKNETNKSESNKNDLGKADGNKNDTNKSDANKNDASRGEAKKPPAPAPLARPRSTRLELDGPPPRPPAPVGPGGSNVR
jgi:hypothetical protein